MKTIKDERLELENLRIKSSAVDLLTMVLTLTLITDFFIHASLATMIDKIILVCILWGYIFIYSLTKRNIISFSNLTNKQLITTATLVTTLLSTIMMSAKNYIEYADK